MTGIALPEQFGGSSGEMDLRLMLARLWAKRWWLTVSVVLFTGGFVAAAFLMVPVYRGTTVVVSADVDRGGAGGLGSSLGAIGGLASLAGINLGSGGSHTEEALAVLRSREFTEGFINDNNLMPELFADRWDPVAKRWRGPEKNWPTLAQAFKFFDNDVRNINHDKKTGLISLQIEWHDPVKAAQWANGLIARLNAEMRTREIASTTASLSYLEKELASTSAVDTRQVINGLMETQINKRMFANVTAEFALRVVDRALPPDPKDIVRPKKLLLIALGPTLGLMFGSFVVLLLGDLLNGRPAPNKATQE